MRPTAAVTAVALVLGTAGSARTRIIPVSAQTVYAECLVAAQKLLDEYRAQPQTGNVIQTVAVACTGPDGTPIDDPRPEKPALPVPTALATAGKAGCVTGASRPVVGTTLTTVSASGLDVTFAWRRLGDTDATYSSGEQSLRFDPGFLTPGATYQWRARATTDDELDDERGWSPWCEFTVAANAIDYRQLGDVSLESLTALGVRPDRDYTVTLSRTQRRLLAEGSDVGRTSARMTLSGPRWTDLLDQLSEWAEINDETALDEAGEPGAVPDGTRFRKLRDAISLKLRTPSV